MKLIYKVPLVPSMWFSRWIDNIISISAQRKWPEMAVSASTNQLWTKITIRSYARSFAYSDPDPSSVFGEAERSDLSPREEGEKRPHKKDTLDVHVIWSDIVPALDGRKIGRPATTSSRDTKQSEASLTVVGWWCEDRIEHMILV